MLPKWAQDLFTMFALNEEKELREINKILRVCSRPFKFHGVHVRVDYSGPMIILSTTPHRFDDMRMRYVYGDQLEWGEPVGFKVELKVSGEVQDE